MEIHQKIPIIMSEIGAIQKAKKNAQQGFMYRGVDDVMNALQPLLHKHGVFIVPEVLEQKREERQTNKGGNLIYSVCTIKYTFYASDGSFITAVVVGEGMDSGDKATNKAMAIAFKYACFQVFCIPTEEMKDPDADTPEPSMPKESAKSKQEPELFICRDCGEVIKPVKTSKGKVYGVREFAAYTDKTYGRPLCAECAKKVANESTDN